MGWGQRGRRDEEEMARVARLGDERSKRIGRDRVAEAARMKWLARRETWRRYFTAALGSRANSVINDGESHICIKGAVVDADAALAADDARWPEEPDDD